MRGRESRAAASTRHRGRLTYGRWALPLAAVTVALALTGCGSRVSHGAIEAAARGVASGGSAQDGGSTQAGSGATGSAAVATTTTVAGGGSVGTGTAGSAASASGAAGTATPASAPGKPATSAAASTPAAASTINLGNVGTYSGLIGSIFTGAQQSLEVWAAYTNAHGGLNGHPVHIFSEDDGGDPSTDHTEVQQEVTQDHVIAFVGDLVPLTVGASVSYLQQQSIPVIGGDASSHTMVAEPDAVPGGLVPLDRGDVTIRAGVATGKTKLGYLYCIEDSTCDDGYQTNIVQRQRQGGRRRRRLRRLVQPDPARLHVRVPGRPAGRGQPALLRRRRRQPGPHGPRLRGAELQAALPSRQHRRERGGAIRPARSTV